jgi:hypothetical protein
MINIRLKKIFRNVIFILWNIFAIIGLVVSAYFLYLVFDEKGYCLSEQHGVWDDEQNICRYDCIKWEKERGCITIDMLKNIEI